MQHNGLATRLLDWSEEAITALFFAIIYYFNQDYAGDEKLPCIWILRPNRMKIYSLELYEELRKHFHFPRVKEHPDSIASLLRLSPKVNRKILYDIVPMPTLAPYIHERIQAQSGVFTLFPIRRECCDYLGIQGEQFSLEDLPGVDEFLLKIVILEPKHVSLQLKQMGIKLSMFFPEIPNVSREIEDRYLRQIKKYAY